MTSHNEKFEREFEAFLTEEDTRLAALYRQLPQTAPDAKLDAAIRAMARRALADQVRVRRLPAARRWLPALGAAAGIVLAAGIVYRLAPTLRNDRIETEAVDGNAVRTRPSDLPSPATPALSTPSEPTVGAGKLQATAAEPKAMPAPTREKASARTESAEAHSDASELSKKENVATPASQPQAFSAAAQEKKRAGEVDAPERKQVIRAETLQNLRDRDVTDTNAGRAVPSAPAAAAAARQAPMPAPEAQTRAALAAPPAQAPVDTLNGITRDEAPASAAAGAVLKAPMQRRDSNASLYPEHWLENIRAMLRENHRDEARRSLEKFREMYPDYQLPEDLRALK